MGLMGSAFGRALAGGGRAVSDIATKYIDEELARTRAQAIADIQHNSNIRTRDANFAFENDPNNVATRVGTAATVAKAAAGTQQQIELDRNNNEPLNESARRKATGDAAAATQAKIDEAYRIATDPQSTEAQRITAERRLAELKDELGARTTAAVDQARGTEQARAAAGAYSARTGEDFKLPPGIKAELDALDKRDEQINGAIVRAQADGMWEPDKNPSQKQLQTQLVANRLRRNQLIQPYLGGGGAADPAGMRGGPGGAAPAAGGMQPTTGDQGARDVEAGKLMIRSEYGGDLNKAREALAQLEAEAAKSTGEARQIMQSEANRLRMGIEAYGKGGGKPLMQSARSRVEEKAPVGVEGYDDRTLARIAAIEGHVNQAAAKAEIARRRAAAPAGDNVGGSAASMLGFGA